MERLYLPKDLSQDGLIETLKRVSESLGHPLCYHLSRDVVDQWTRFTYQTATNPRTDDVIRRC